MLFELEFGDENVDNYLTIKNGYIYNVDDGVFEHKDILIKNGVIVKVDNRIEFDAKQEIDATNHLIMPGFVNSHIHFGEFFLSGYKNKLTTKQYIRFAENFNDKNVSNKSKIWEKSAAICTFEALKHGQTTLVGIRGWNFLEEFNARLYMGYPLMDSNKLREYLINSFSRFESLKRSELNHYYIFLHSLLTVNENVVKELSKYIKNKNILLGIHVSESRYENNYIKKKYGLTPIELLNKFNLLNKNTILIHCCYLNNNDIKIIKDAGCTISLNPKSNLKLKNRVPNIKKLEGINLCVGTDGIATNGNLNILNDCKTLGLLYDIKDVDLIKMITVNPAVFLNNNIGNIKEGYKADLNIYDLNDHRIVRKETFINNLIYSSEILPKYVIINGRKIIDKYKNIVFNEERFLNLNCDNIEIKYSQKE